MTEYFYLTGKKVFSLCFYKLISQISLVLIGKRAQKKQDQIKQNTTKKQKEKLCS